MCGSLASVSEQGVWLVVGAQAAGKSTVADLLARQFDLGVHVRGGQFYRWAVKGWVHPHGDLHEPEARRLLDLRYRLSAMTADQYFAAGFTTVVQDNIFGDDVATWLAQVDARPRHLVVLRPSIAVVNSRDAERQRTLGKIAYRPGDHTIEQLDAALGETPRIGLWLDSSGQTPAETVTEILTRKTEARIDDLTTD